MAHMVFSKLNLGILLVTFCIRIWLTSALLICMCILRFCGVSLPCISFLRNTIFSSLLSWKLLRNSGGVDHQFLVSGFLYSPDLYWKELNEQSLQWTSPRHSVNPLQVLDFNQIAPNTMFIAYFSHAFQIAFQKSVHCSIIPCSCSWHKGLNFKLCLH